MSWPIEKLGSLVSIKGGGTPSKKVEEYWNGNIPWASVKDLKSRILLRTEDSITQLGVDKSATNVIPKNTIIIPTRMALGKVAIAGVDLAINQDLKALFINNESILDKEYLARFLESKATYIEGEGKGATVKGITLDFLKELQIPLPPLEEQKRIAAILDKADAICQKRKQAIELADEFLRSVFLDMFGDIPAKISKYSFSGCRGAVLASSGKSSKHVISDKQTDIPVYGGNGINGYSTEVLYEEPVVIVGRVGQQCAITNLSEGPCWVTDNAIVLKIIDESKYDAAYLAHALIHSPIRNSVTQLDLPFINQSMILDYPIPLPPIEEQRKFSAIRTKLKEHMSIQTTAFEQSEVQFKALSQNAFSGQL
ncbi:restriction endonuclease subunit S [Aliivibrio fischeri]|uniref:restriction endonuclease subunit S n=1 Tax=Aliivibrio fischeri TaxID=668 RepID=UPI001F42CD2E|nr:restriction endonuclease subunit S [Aliivibrio fischeri]MCE4935198.1 restriction endonuclease subunit S [Aliivibrio fischeri]